MQNVINVNIDLFLHNNSVNMWGLKVCKQKIFISLMHFNTKYLFYVCTSIQNILSN